MVSPSSSLAERITAPIRPKPRPANSQVKSVASSSVDARGSTAFDADGAVSTTTSAPRDSKAPRVPRWIPATNWGMTSAGTSR